MSSGVVAGVRKAASAPVKFVRFDATRSDLVEIIIGDVVVRAGGGIEPDRLVEVIRAVRRA
jgi:transposase